MTTECYLYMHQNIRSMHNLVGDIEELRSNLLKAAEKLRILEVELRMESHSASISEAFNLVKQYWSSDDLLRQDKPPILSSGEQHTSQEHHYPFDFIGSDSEKYKNLILHGITDCMLRLESNPCQDSREIFIKYIYELSQAYQQEKTLRPQLDQDADRVKNKVKVLRVESLRHRVLLEQCKAHYNDAVEAKTRRDLYHGRLKVSQAGVLPQAETIGRVVVIDHIEHWIPVSTISRPDVLDDVEKLAYKRAERLLMEEEEERCWAVIKLHKLNQRLSGFQALWRGLNARKQQKLLLMRYNEAVPRIQRFWRKSIRNGDRLPIWCVLGREVLIEVSLAKTLAISFTFVPKKDFPPGNWKHLEGKTLEEMMEICREDEYSAGFATNGTFKRFIPRKLTQLKTMEGSYDLACKPGEALGQCGLYIKTRPTRKNECIRMIQSGIIVRLPHNRRELVTVVVDGVRSTAHVPISALTDRWKHVWIQERNKSERTRQVGMRVTVGQKSPHRVIRNYPPEDLLINREDVNIVRPATLRKSALTDDGKRSFHDEPTLSLVYEDQLTHLLMREVPSQRTHHDSKEREQVIEERMKAYRKAWLAFCTQQELNSVVTIQCAWRSRQARREFRRILELRMQEEQHEDELTHRIGNPEKHPVVLTGFFRSKRRGRVPKPRLWLKP
uniref:Uncharacterized protein AlNc14C30G2791 n=1 Tax=Albugo laibachii Nc14 TaxID=890382 RepID=F0W7I5_9STRA|nr:conserved hypothetical protein [Albugo laibachii Nc14]|eukprot:CCA17086.1 conserved hypothetical protein [Albugo laibachii Nc14]